MASCCRAQRLTWIARFRTGWRRVTITLCMRRLTTAKSWMRRRSGPFTIGKSGLHTEAWVSGRRASIDLSASEDLATFVYIAGLSDSGVLDRAVCLDLEGGGLFGDRDARLQSLVLFRKNGKSCVQKRDLKWMRTCEGSSDCFSDSPFVRGRIVRKKV